MQEGRPACAPLQAEGDKVARARTMAARYEIGAVYHLLGASWRSDWDEDLVGFPSGEHDDQVDTAAYAGIVLVQDIGVEEEGEIRGRNIMREKRLDYLPQALSIMVNAAFRPDCDANSLCIHCARFLSYTRARRHGHTWLRYACPAPPPMM